MAALATINLGTGPNTSTGDPIRVGGATINTAINAVSKRTIVSLLEFCVGDGVTDEFTALTEAFALGIPLTGHGATYAIAGNLIVPSTGLYLEDAHFLQLTPQDPVDEMRRTLFGDAITGDVTLKNVSVNRGTDLEAGLGHVPNYAAVWLGFDPAGTGKLVIDGLEVTGNGAGNVITVSDCNSVSAKGLYAHDLAYASSGSPSSERISAITFLRCSNIDVDRPVIDNVYGVISTTIIAIADNGSGKVRCTCQSTGYMTNYDRPAISDAVGTPLLNGDHLIKIVDTTHFDVFQVAYVAPDTNAVMVQNIPTQTRGLDFIGCSHYRVNSGKISRVSAGSDNSGSYQNSNGWFFGTTFEDCWTYGLKFVHDISNSGAIGCTTNRTGFLGFTIGTALEGASHLEGPTDIRYIGCNAVDTGFTRHWASSSGYGAITPNAGGAFLQNDMMMMGCISRDTSSISLSIISTAANGAGKVRCYVPTTASMTTGQYVIITGAVNTPLLNGFRTVTVVDGTHFDVTAVTWIANDTFAKITNNAITVTANNGSGKVRCTVHSTDTMFNGQVVYIAGAFHPVTLNGYQTITVIDSTHFDVPAVTWVANDSQAGVVTPVTVLLASTADNGAGKVRVSVQATLVVSATANNGSGKVRCTVPSTAKMVTEQVFTFPTCSGTPNLGPTSTTSGENIITVIDPTHFDCSGVAFVLADSNLTITGPTQTNYWVTGQLVRISGTSNTPGLNDFWPVTIVDETHFDLLDVDFGTADTSGLITSLPTMVTGYRNDLADASSVRLLGSDSFGHLSAATSGINSGVLNVDANDGHTSILGGITVGGASVASQILGSLEVDSVFLRPRSNPVVLANGLNSNIPISNTGNIPIQDSGADFSFGGFAQSGPVVDGSEIFLVYFGTKTGTIIAGDAASTALGNGISTMTAGNIVLTAGRFIITMLRCEQASPNPWVVKSIRP